MDLKQAFESMKIVYLIRSFALKAGTERVISDKMNFLAENGHEVILITYEQGTHPHAFQLHSSIRHVDFGTCFYKIEKYNWLKRLPASLRMRKQFRERLQSLLNDVQPDVFISTTYSIILMDIILSIKTNASRIVESHVACYSVKKSNNYRHRPILQFIASLYDWWMLGKIAKADQMVVLTNGDANDWRKYTANVVVIPNPVTCYPDSILSHDGSGHRILCAGRLIEQKGFDMLIDAFALIAHQCKAWIIDIYGDGSDKDMLIEKIHHKNLVGRININPPTSAIYNEYQRSEFYVLSSRYEGLPLVLGEAMSCGIPCVAFRCKYGPEDVIENQETGLLVDNGNVQDLAEKILWMINHTEERLQMGKNARQAAMRFKKDVIMQRWLELFNHITTI